MLKMKNVLLSGILMISVSLFGNAKFQVKMEPSFDCKKAETQVEKAVCSNNTTSNYDAILGYLYKTICSLSNDLEKSKIKSEQKKWMQKDREEGFKEEQKIIKEKTFDCAWINRINYAYGKRISDILIKYKNKLQDYFFEEFQKYEEEDSIPKPLKFSFFWFIFANHYVDEDDKDQKEDLKNYVYRFCVDNETRMIKMNKEEWLIVFRGSSYLENTNEDGGGYTFFVFNPTCKKLSKLKADDIVSRSYFISADANEIILGYTDHSKNVTSQKEIHLKYNKSRAAMEEVMDNKKK